LNFSHCKFEERRGKMEEVWPKFTGQLKTAKENNYS